MPPQATFPSQTNEPAQALLAASFMPTRSSNVPYHGFFGSPYNVTSQLPQHTHEFPGISHAQSGGSQQYPSTLHQLSNASQHVTSSLTNSASAGSSASEVGNSSSPSIATPQTLTDQTWYVDSGATNHMTADTNNLLMKSNYQGGSQVQVGNGQAVPITHIGMSFIPSNSSYRVLQLKNMLCVKKIAKNLLSISQITKDNDVIVEFHSDHCLIKDKATRAVLLQGSLKDGLYQLQVSAVAQNASASQSPHAHLHIADSFSSNKIS